MNIRRYYRRYLGKFKWWCLSCRPINGFLCWVWGLLIWIDQGFNALLWPVLNAGVKRGGAMFGNPDETLSSVMGKNVERGTCGFLSGGLSGFELAGYGSL